MFSIVPYFGYLVLHPFHSLLLVYAVKHLYDKYLNNEIYEKKSKSALMLRHISVLYCRVPTGTFCYNISDKYSYGRYEYSDMGN